MYSTFFFRYLFHEPIARVYFEIEKRNEPRKRGHTTQKNEKRKYVPRTCQRRAVNERDVRRGCASRTVTAVHSELSGLYRLPGYTLKHQSQSQNISANLSSVPNQKEVSLHFTRTCRRLKQGFQYTVSCRDIIKYTGSTMVSLQTDTNVVNTR